MTEKRSNRTWIFTTIAALTALLVIAGIHTHSGERYEFPFHAETIDYITMYHGCESDSKEIRGQKEIKNIVSSLQSLKVYPWKEMEFADGNESMGLVFHLSDGTEENLFLMVLLW